MTRTRVAAAVLAALALALGGCSVGRFVAGAPRPGAGPAGTLTARAAPASSGRALLSRRCMGCHDRPEPARMTAREWQQALVRMQARMKLPQAEWDSLAALAARTAVAREGVAR